MTQGHPDPDDLADLAADVLDAEAAVSLRAHVDACAGCAGLMDDALRVRSLLLAEDPGPMPDEVWARIEHALAQEVADSTLATAAERSDGSSAGQPGDAPGAVTILTSAPSDDDRPTTKLRRPIRSVHSTRREQRRDHAGRWSGLRSNFGWGGLTAVAAGVVIVLGVGVTLVQGLLPDGSDVTAGMFADQADGSGPAALDSAERQSVIVGTGTNYQAAKLAAQVRALVATVHGTTAGSGTDTTSTATEDTQPMYSMQDKGLPAGAWSSKELAACLKAIDAEDLSPVAVDFATFDGRDVALLVLPSPAQEYEVWAVSRSCKPGDDGTQFFQIVKP